MILFRTGSILGFLILVSGFRNYDKNDLIALREEVRSMFNYAYSGYLSHAYPYDELRSLSCDGFDTWGSFSLTLIDALDTLAVMGNFSEFRRVAEIISSRENFEANINVSVFETNIRVVGGLLSAHMLSRKAGVKLEPGWPCNGPLLRLAEDMAKRLIAAFDTPTGMPYGTVNLKYGVPEGETSITCTAGIGTFLLEFGTLSRLTGDPLYEEVAMNAIKALHYYKSNIGLVGNHIDVLTGHWTAQDSGIGAGIDSYFEYLAKGTLLFQDPLLASIFQDYRKSIEKYIRREDWHLWVSMTKGQVTLPVFQSLDAYWPGVLSLFGEIADAMKSLHNYHRVWKQFGFTPEFYNIPQAEAGTNRESYPLRPELIESVMYLYRATRDPWLIQVGVDMLKSLQHSAKTTCGYATINDVRDHRKADRMESFFLAETTKYLYLLFDTDNFIHNTGSEGEIIDTQWGRCVVDAGGYIFNTEAHPIDPGALYCCRPAREIFPDKKPVLKRFLPISPNTIPEDNEVTPNDLRFEKNVVETKNPIVLPITIAKLSEIRNHEVNTKKNAVDDNSSSSNVSSSSSLSSPNDDSVANENENHATKFEETEEKFNRTVRLSSTQILAPSSTIYKADDSDGFDGFESQILSNGQYSTSTNAMIQSYGIRQNATPNPAKIRFEPQIMLENMRRENLYPTNVTARQNYQILSCQAQPFLQRMSIIGEFF